jgi:hypothetical protein
LVLTVAVSLAIVWTPDPVGVVLIVTVPEVLRLTTAATAELTVVVAASVIIGRAARPAVAIPTRIIERVS